MEDPLRLLAQSPRFREQGQTDSERAAILRRVDPLRQSALLIRKYELRIWFEPKWSDGRQLARLFPDCLVVAVPEESDTPALRKIPGWRPLRRTGAVL